MIVTVLPSIPLTYKELSYAEEKMQPKPDVTNAHERPEATLGFVHVVVDVQDEPSRCGTVGLEPGETASRRDEAAVGRALVG